MKQVTIYLNKSVIFSTLIAILLVLGLDFIFSIFEGLGQVRSNFQLPQLIFYSLMTLLDSLIVFLPFIVLISAVIGIARLKSSNELVIMQAAGLSKWKLVLTSSLGLAIFTGAVLIASEFWQLKVANYMESYKFEKKWLHSNSDAILQDSDIWLDVKNSLVRIQLAREDGVLFGITQFEFDENNNLQKLTQAKKATEVGKYDWRLEEVKQIEFANLEQKQALQETSKQINSKTMDFLNVYLPIDTHYISFSDTKARQMNLKSLYGYARYLDQKSNSSEIYWTLFWRKVFMPFSLFFLVALGASFIFESSRTKPLSIAIFKVLFLGTVFILVQDSLAPIATSLNLSPFLTVLTPIAALGIFAFFRLERIT